MKKLMMLTAAVVFLGFGQLQAKSDSEINNAMVYMQDVTWEEIERSELPQAVNDAFVKDYSDYTFNKALKGSDGHYKIKAVKDGTEYYFKYNESGELHASGKTADKKME